MQIALIGGAGFIGTVLAKHLMAKGYDVVIVDIKPSDFLPEKTIIADVTDQESLIKSLVNIDVIYNLAAEHRDDVYPRQKYYDVNVRGAENIVLAAKTHDIKTIIFTSTVAVYGLNADPKKGACEEMCPAPFNDYGHSKLSAEKVFANWASEKKDRILSVARLVATFGPNNRGNIYTLIDQVARDRFVMVGPGKNRKSIAYVENVASFLSHMLTFKAGIHTYNYADKPDLQARDLIKKIRKNFGLSGIGYQVPYVFGLFGGFLFDILSKVTGRRFPISSVRVRKFCANTVVNADKLKDTGFVVPYTLEQGLQAMIDSDFRVDETHLNL